MCVCVCVCVCVLCLSVCVSVCVCVCHSLLDLAVDGGVHDVGGQHVGQEAGDGGQTLTLHQPQVHHARDAGPVGAHEGNGRKHRRQGWARTSSPVSIKVISHRQHQGLQSPSASRSSVTVSIKVISHRQHQGLQSPSASRSSVTVSIKVISHRQHQGRQSPSPSASAVTVMIKIIVNFRHPAAKATINQSHHGYFLQQVADWSKLTNRKL